MAIKEMKMFNGMKMFNSIEEMRENVRIQNQWRSRKAKARHIRNNNEKYKTKERVKTLRYQKVCDKYKKNLMKKGKGRMKKIKGEILPSLIACNDLCTKSWRYVGYGSHNPLKEGFKHYTIYDIT